MYALEPEPEKNNRGRRFLIGIIIFILLAAGLLITVKYIKPTQRLLPEIIQILTVDEQLPKKEESLPPPPLPPPKQEKQIVEKSKPVEQKIQEKQPEPEQNNAQPQVGLDESSFTGNGNGVAFHAGTTQMGDPNQLEKNNKPIVINNSIKIKPAHALNPSPAKYPERARRHNVEGIVILEADINEHGELLHLRLHQGCDPDLDEAAQSTVKNWKFQPATLDGYAIPSTRLIQIEFALN